VVVVVVVVAVVIVVVVVVAVVLVAYLKEPSLFFVHVIQWYMNCVGLLVNKHSMTLTESATANILSTDSHVKTFTSQFTPHTSTMLMLMLQTLL